VEERIQPYPFRVAAHYDRVELARRGGGVVVHDQQDCYKSLRTLLNNKKAAAKAGAISLNLVKENIGATERFIEHLEKVL
jgi:3-deoxy-D-manno-octulosonic-acid transferase